ncbi:MAG: NUDIX domain-containing protein [Pseudomonadota bacterium]
MRRYGEPWLPGRPYRDRPGVYAIILGHGPRAGLILTVTQAMEAGPEVQLPGGGIDPGEQPIAALHREVMEETGWRITAPRRIAAFQRFSFLPDYRYWARKTQTIYRARATTQAGPPLEPNHIPLWLPPAEAVDCLSVAGDRAILARFLGLSGADTLR